MQTKGIRQLRIGETVRVKMNGFSLNRVAVCKDLNGAHGNRYLIHSATSDFFIIM